jgi:O-antigen ligase
MMLAPVWRTRIYAAVAALLAIWLGNGIAQQELGLPFFLTGGIVGLLLLWWRPMPIATFLLGGVLFGYVVGNRGFAQLYLSNSLPLLPAELVLLVGGIILAAQSAFRRELPFRREPLNLLILLWLILGTGRVFFDVRTYGFAALRDYATVYYTGFFFLAQVVAREPAGKRFVLLCLVSGCTLLLPLSVLSEQFPGFFLETLTVRGTPLIFYKGDLLGTFFAIGALIYFIRFEERGRWWSLGLSLVFIGGTLASSNRASMLALGVATVLLAVCGRWKFAVVQAVVGVIAALVILLVAHVGEIAMENTPLYGLYERVISVVDPMGQRTYTGDTSFDKGDNNLFRSVWWRAVFDETIDGNPWLGLGFGHDLADRFVRQYYPEAGEEFTTRSPHNVLLTIFARMGVVGLLPFLAIAGLAVTRAAQAIRARQNDNIIFWCCALIILMSACLGVVLEGPMGAVVFWTLLGLANTPESADAAAPGSAAEAAAALQPAVTSPEVAVSS